MTKVSPRSSGLVLISALLVSVILLSACQAMPVGLAKEQRKVAITIDDAPLPDGLTFSGAERARRLVAHLAEADAKVAFFVSGQNVRSRTDLERLAFYGRSGHFLAMHGYEHRGFASHDAHSFLADLSRVRRTISGLPNAVDWYRFPGLNEGRTPQDRALARNLLEHLSITNAYVTASFADYAIADEVNLQLAEGRTLNCDALVQIYSSLAIASLEARQNLALRVTGRAPVQVLLLHENDLAAVLIDDLIEALKKANWKVVAPAEAYIDPLTREARHALRSSMPIEALALEEGLSHEAMGLPTLDAQTVILTLHDGGVFEDRGVGRLEQCD